MRQIVKDLSCEIPMKWEYFITKKTWWDVESKKYINTVGISRGITRAALKERKQLIEKIMEE